jgi:Leu/Phe-tRNA-protein transferase
MKKDYLLTLLILLLIKINFIHQISAQDEKSLWMQKPETVKSLLNLSNSNLSEGKIFLMNSSHQDIAWMDSPEKCIIERDTMLLTPLYDRAIIDPSYRYRKHRKEINQTLTISLKTAFIELNLRMADCQQF